MKSVQDVCELVSVNLSVILKGYRVKHGCELRGGGRKKFWGGGGGKGGIFIKAKLKTRFPLFFT